MNESRSRGTGATRLERGLLDGLEREFAAVAERAGAWLVCGPGCSECCHGPFPLTRLDVNRLRRGLDELRRREPIRAEALSARAAAAVVRLTPGFPGDAATGRLAADERELDRFFDRHEALACPALDEASGSCELYDARPVACRTYGPPLAFGGRRAEPCRLWFAGADEATVESCRLVPDPEGREAELLERLGVRPGEEWETLIAFTLADDAPPQR